MFISKHNNPYKPIHELLKYYYLQNGCRVLFNFKIFYLNINKIFSYFNLDKIVHK